MWEDDDEDENPSGCPFCGNFGCEHLLISLDETFRWADGGPLAEAFNTHWSNLTEAGGDDFDEYEPWLDLVLQCEDYGNRDAYYRDSGPGTATNTIDFYCASKEQVSKSVLTLKGIWLEAG